MTHPPVGLHSLRLKEIVRRFPFGCWSIFGLWLVSMMSFAVSDKLFSSADVNESLLYHLILVAFWLWLNAVTLSVFELSTELFAQSKKAVSVFAQKAIKLLILSANAVVVLFVLPLNYSVFQTMSSGEFSPEIFPKMCYLFGYVLIVALLVLVSGAAPNLKRSKQMFYLWYSLFSTVVTVSFFAAVIMIGSTIAISTIHVFFGLELFKSLSYIFITVATLISPLKGLSMLPSAEKIYEGNITLHAVYSFFVRKIVTAIVTVYLGLLYLFALKQLFLVELPQGGVVYSILGLLIPVVCLAILYFPERFEENKISLLDLYLRKGIHLFSIPMVIMYLLSIGIRIADYGVTIPRYFVMILGVWLLLFNVYWAFSKKTRLASIPILTFVLVMITLYMPVFNIFSLSLNSQLSRLENQLIEKSLLNADHTQLLKAASTIDDPEVDFSIVKYLKDSHYSRRLVEQKPYLKDLAALNRIGQTDTMTIIFNDSIDAASENFLIQQNSKVFANPVNVYEQAIVERLYVKRSGEKIHLRFSLMPDAKVKLQHDSQTLLFDLNPLFDALKPSLTSKMDSTFYVNKNFPDNVSREVFAEDANLKIMLYITGLNFELPPNAQNQKISEVNNLTFILVVSEK